MDISVVVPLYNEEESLNELVSWIQRVMDENKFSFEIVLIDDGSDDGSWNIVEELKAKLAFIRGIKFRRNYGKSAALYAGFEAAEGDVVITMDAYLQDSPDEIPELYKMIMKDGFDLVSGWKKKRHDPFSKRFPSKIYNRSVRMLTGIKLHDFNCGLKAYRKDVIKSVEVYGEMHRYIPVLAKKEGFNNIGEKVVQHRARKYGVTKFGLGRAKGLLDLLTISFIATFGKKPMHFFGAWGTLMGIVGFIAAGYLGARKLVYLWNGEQAGLVTESPFFYIALALMIIGSQLFLTGFLAELTTRNAPDRNNYLVEKEL
jgi:glycosyltransferase involved in cell wall biosynthesis